MNLSRIFILRPIATSLMMVALLIAGLLAYRLLPISALPEVDYPTIQVTTLYPGASPDVMTSNVTAPLERQFGQMPGLSQMSSTSSGGASVITLRFALDMALDVAEQQVQAAINAGSNLLPNDLPMPPIYSKVNPADAPILTLAITSPSLPVIRLNDLVENRLAPKLSQVNGVGLVAIAGGRRPAVRIQANPAALASLGLTLEDVRTVIAAANVKQAKGGFDGPARASTIDANDQLQSAQEYRDLILAFKNGNPIRLRDVAQTVDGAENTRLAAWAGTPETGSRAGVILNIRRQPGANVIDTVDRIKALLPQLQSTLPASLDVQVLTDRTTTIRASVKDMQVELALAIGLVVAVIFVFLRSASATLIPSFAVPLSLVGTFGVMYLAGFSINNLTLMALTISTGFVVDDAIVVLENIMRHMERGKTALQASLDGAREIGFTVVSMSLSLIAVFVPILFMGGIVGRFFHEFAIVMSAAILVSLLVSLTTTPMMCAALLKQPHRGATAPGAAWWARFSRWVDGLQARGLRGYRRSLAWCLRHQPLVLLVLGGVVGLNVTLYTAIEKGFMPEQDTGRISGFIRADQATSYQAMEQRLQRFLAIVQADPAVEHVTGFTGGWQRNAAQMFMTLQRGPGQETSEAVITRLRAQLKDEPGARLFMVPQRDIRIGGRQSSASFDYTLQADDIAELRTWEPRIRQALAQLPELEDVNSDVSDYGLQTTLVIDRDAATRAGLTMATIDATLNDAFGQRQVGVIYNPLNQYRVVMEAAPRYLQSPETLRGFFFVNSAGQQVPLTAFARITTTNTPLSVSHERGTPASTVSFSLAPGVSLSQATDAVHNAVAELGVPVGIRGTFGGTAGAFQDALAGQPLLILAAIITIYLVLGILYENLLHPLTILSTLPSAGVGALLALMLFKTEFSLIALIGVILLIGIVKKNAIMMIDFALVRQRAGHITAAQSIYRACSLRLRPILMTTLAAIFGALPLALNRADGAELRQPLGIAVVGGLVLSQLLTLYTTPVVYVALDRLRGRLQRWAPWRRHPTGGPKPALQGDS